MPNVPWKADAATRTDAVRRSAPHRGVKDCPQDAVVGSHRSRFQGGAHSAYDALHVERRDRSERGANRGPAERAFRSPSRPVPSCCRRLCVAFAERLLHCSNVTLASFGSRHSPRSSWTSTCDLNRLASAFFEKVRARCRPPGSR